MAGDVVVVLVCNPHMAHFVRYDGINDSLRIFFADSFGNQVLHDCAVDLPAMFLVGKSARLFCVLCFLFAPGLFFCATALSFDSGYPVTFGAFGGFLGFAGGAFFGFNAAALCFLFAQLRGFGFSFGSRLCLLGGDAGAFYGFAGFTFCTLCGFTFATRGFLGFGARLGSGFLCDAALAFFLFAASGFGAEACQFCLLGLVLLAAQKLRLQHQDNGILGLTGGCRELLPVVAKRYRFSFSEYPGDGGRILTYCLRC